MLRFEVDIGGRFLNVIIFLAAILDTLVIQRNLEARVSFVLATAAHVTRKQGIVWSAAATLRDPGATNVRKPTTAILWSKIVYVSSL